MGSSHGKLLSEGHASVVLAGRRAGGEGSAAGGGATGARQQVYRGAAGQGGGAETGAGHHLRADVSGWKDGVPAQIHSAHESAGQLPPHWVKMAPVFAPVQLHDNTMEGLVCRCLHSNIY